MPTAEILSQGDEVVTGQIADTNAAWIAQELTDLGFTITRHVTVGDRLADIRDLFATAAERADLVVCTGGLGPTEDDLTAEALAAAFGVSLALDEEALGQIEAMYTRFGREMPPSNRKQAVLPVGAHRLDNPRGTAPGFAFDTARGFLACMPGVPHEMRHMLRAQVVPRAVERFHLTPGRLVTIRTAGVGESTLQGRIEGFSRPHIVLGFRTFPTENHVKLRAIGSVSDAALEEAVGELRQRIGTPVFAVEGLGEPGGDLATVIGRQLMAAGHTLAVAESCTGGGVASTCTAVAGASAWFMEAAVTYSNAAKVRSLGVDPAAIEAHGAVSEIVARQMAEGVRDRAGTDYGLSTTGIAGPGGGSEAKPVGTVHMALATPVGTTHRLVRLGGSRERIQRIAVVTALDLLRRHLDGTYAS